MAKFCTINTPLFREAGLNITESWGDIDLSQATPEQRDLLEQYLGRIVQVHPEDQAEFEASTAGLRIEGNRLVGADDIGSRHAARAAKTPNARAPQTPSTLARTSTGALANPPASVPEVVARDNEGGDPPVQPQPETGVPDIGAEPPARGSRNRR